MIGEKISHYKILEKLGEGGMGEVFLAEDTKLKRKVALKFLPKEFTRDQEAKERFLQEARAAATLDHPNICSIFEIDETENNQLFIAMAYYDGETLKEKIEKGPLKIKEALNISVQIASGLKKAHEKGIVHRDIKSANILITKDNMAKILDFGLAKLKGQTRLTKEGTTLGTVSYMSPEQAQGEKVDHRSDIWSLGVVLYEMISGQLPFKGEYEQAVLYSIMNEEPEPLTSVRTNVPIKLEEILKKLLSKDPDLRFQHVDELPVDLKYINLKTSILTKSTVQKVSFGKKPLLWQIIAIIAVFFAILARWFPKSTPDIPVPISSLKITTATGLESYPSWAPEGKRLAFHSNQQGNYDIWVTQVSGGLPHNLTSDHPGRDMYPIWSHDGNFIAFWSERKGGGYYVMPALGDSPSRINFKNEPFSGIAQWSENDRRLAAVVTDKENNFFIEILDLQTSASSLEIKVPNKDNVYDLSWSFDGKFFAYVDAPDRSWDASQIFILDKENGKKFPVTDGMTNNWNPSWAKSSRTLYFVSNRGGSMDLWRQHIKKDGSVNESPERITAAVGMRSAAWSPAEDRLAFSKGKNVLNVWTAPIGTNQLATDDQANQLTFFQAATSLLEFSRDGVWLYFTSDIKGNHDLWKMHITERKLIQLTRHPSMDFHARISPDGTRILFHSMRSGNRDLWILSVEGGPPEQVTHHPASDLWADWSPDGQKIVFTSTRSGNLDIWEKSLKDQTTIQLTTDPADDTYPHFFPDRFVYFRSNRNGLASVWRIPAGGGKTEQISEGDVYRYGANKKSGTFYFSTMRDGRKNIWELSVNPRFERRITDFGNTFQGQLRSNIIASPNNNSVFFSYGGSIGDIHVMDFEKK